MSLENKRSTKSLLFPLLFGSILGFISLYYFYNNINLELNLEELALGAENSTSLEFVNNVQVHCHDFDDIHHCLEGYKNSRPEEDVVLWLGNSQLHSINQIKSKDVTAPHLLHSYSVDDKKYVLTLSQPNANLQEHYLLFEYLQDKLKIETLILPIVFDDMRETGIRPSLLDGLNNSNVIERLSETLVGKDIYLSSGNSNFSGNDITALDGTFQAYAEELLNNKLKDKWVIWNSRELIRGHLFANMYFFRNWLLGISPSSIRKIIPGRYKVNMDALAAVLNSAKKQKINVIMYIVPLRNDIKTPYNILEYSNFKKELTLLSSTLDINFLNLESLVPSNYWGTKNSTSLNKEQELDFMHFQADGHKLLAEMIYDELQNIWIKEK